MAFLVNHSGLTFINVTKSVGAGGVNNYDDVFVVQAFLSLIQQWGSADLLSKGFTPYLRGVNGVCDRKTLEAIRRYQTDNLTKGKRSRSVSGLVRTGEDPPKMIGSSYVSTIYSLNDSLLGAALADQENQFFPKSLRNDPIKSNNCVSLLSYFYGRELMGILARGRGKMKIEIDI